jgi:hypothetical protein
MYCTQIISARNEYTLHLKQFKYSPWMSISAVSFTHAGNFIWPKGVPYESHAIQQRHFSTFNEYPALKRRHMGAF